MLSITNHQENTNKTTNKTTTLHLLGWLLSKKHCLEIRRYLNAQKKGNDQISKLQYTYIIECNVSLTIIFVKSNDFEKCSNGLYMILFLEGKRQLFIYGKYTYNVIGYLWVVKALVNFCFVFLIHIFSIYNIYIICNV